MPADDLPTHPGSPFQRETEFPAGRKRSERTSETAAAVWRVGRATELITCGGGHGNQQL